MKPRALVAAASALAAILATAPAAAYASNPTPDTAHSTPVDAPHDAMAINHTPMPFADSHGTGPWAGYVDQAHANVKFRYVATNFVIPRVTCTSPISKASFWAGLDGAGTSTVEQVGISTNCFNGQPAYLAWWEMYPQGTQYQFYVHPGDSIFAAVFYNYSTGVYSLALNDNTSGDSFNHSARCPSGSTCQNATAEVILEADNGSDLSQFTPVTFTGCAVTTRNGTHGTFEDDYYWDLYKRVMTGPNGLLATVSALTNNGATFSITYRRSS